MNEWNGDRISQKSGVVTIDTKQGEVHENRTRLDVIIVEVVRHIDRSTDTEDCESMVRREYSIVRDLSGWL
jgi:hypothetical protein